MRTVWSRLAALAALLTVLLLPVSALAATDPYKGACGDPAAATSTVCQTRSTPGDPLTGENGIIIRATRIIAIIAGFAAVIIMALGGITYITSGGDSNKVSQAKRTLIYGAIGLVVIVLAQAIIGYIIGRI